MLKVRISLSFSFISFRVGDLLFEVSQCNIPGMCAASQTNNLGSVGSQNCVKGLRPAISAACCALFMISGLSLSRSSAPEPRPVAKSNK